MELHSEISALRHALRESRTRLRRSAWQSTRQICRLHAEIKRLESVCAELRRRIERHASGVAIVDLGQALMRLAENNERLKGSAHRVWQLERNLEAAHAECSRLAEERDALAAALHRPDPDRLTA